MKCRNCDRELTREEIAEGIERCPACRSNDDSGTKTAVTVAGAFFAVLGLAVMIATGGRGGGDSA